MKKLLFSMILLLIQIGKGETVAHKSRIEQPSVGTAEQQDFAVSLDLQKGVSEYDANSDVAQDDESHDRAVVKVVKVLGFTLLGLAGAFTALVVLAIGNGGIGGC